MVHDKRNKDAVQKRLSRLSGQVQGVARMVDEDRYCVDILNQTAAIRSALRAVERLIIEDHARTCMEDAIVAGDQDRQRIMFQEVVALLEKVRD
ncbi:metal-sensitive transcriptional regulator [uncultured Jannaschia sp.]|uniref:metal-sensitive transcriptional regulator n=1 Tax=uncultured Jannaschia sp. TaxID=293347 RepID=UPI00261227EC|nr:metal-sensitive transcriptional regulator [uncultured Jannaschia sp.]